MKNKIKFLALVCGVTASIASLSSLTAYADDATITTTVNPSITIDVTPSTENLKGNSGVVMTGAITTTVISNTAYTLSFRTATDETSMTSEESGIKDTIPASTDVRANNSAWGIKKKTSPGDTDNEATYTAIDATNPGKVLYESNTGSTGATPIKFDVGISTASNIAASVYSVNLVITASQK